MEYDAYRLGSQLPPEQAVYMAHDGALAPTLKIKYFEADEKNKYPKIVSYELGEVPEYYAGMNRKKTWEDYDLKEDGIGDPF